MPVSLIRAAADDEPFLLTVYAATRAAEMKIAPWTAEQKDLFVQAQFQARREYYQTCYPNGSVDIIYFEKKAVGTLYLAELTAEIRIVDLTVLPAHRNKGIGAKIVKGVLQTGTKKQKPVQIYIENFNPSAKLFARLGFLPAAEQGIHVLWRWTNFADDLT